MNAAAIYLLMVSLCAICIGAPLTAEYAIAGAVVCFAIGRVLRFWRG